MRRRQLRFASLITLVFALVPVGHPVKGEVSIGKITQPTFHPGIGSGSSRDIVPSLEGWRYASVRDEFTDSVAKAATIDSVNRVYFEAPYEGGSRLSITVVNNRGKIGLMLEIDKGQFFCRLSGCAVSFRFNNGHIRSFEAKEASSGSPDRIFIMNPALIRLLTSAVGVKVRAQFFEHGYEVFDFFAKTPLDLSQLK